MCIGQLLAELQRYNNRTTLQINTGKRGTSTATRTKGSKLRQLMQQLRQPTKPRRNKAVNFTNMLYSHKTSIS
jgi:hypothetical protein